MRVLFAKILHLLRPPEALVQRLIYFCCVFLLILAAVRVGMYTYTFGRSFYFEQQRVAADFSPLLALQKPLGVPAPGEWLYEHFEPGQTIAEFKASHASKPLPDPGYLYFQVIEDLHGVIDKDLLHTVQRFSSEYFCAPARVIDSEGIEHPSHAIRAHPETGRQLLTPYLLKHVMTPRRPEDAIAFIGLSGTDLWPGRNWNFVFGQASSGERVGVWSVARFGVAGERSRLLRRTLKTATHEIGHMLGMSHCISFQCNMNGSNHLAEADSHPMYLCPHCLEKLTARLECSLAKRYQALGKILHESDLSADAQEYEKLLEVLPE